MNPTSVPQKSKRKYLEETIHTSEKFIPFLVTNETHFDEDVLDAEVAIKDYNIHRADRKTRKGGGTSIYVHNSIQIDNVQKYSDTVCESVMLYNKAQNQVIIGIYRPPKGSPTLDINTSFTNLLKQVENFISKLKNVDLLMMGDFNLPSIDWSSETVIPGKADKKCAETFIHFMNKHLLTQHVEETTRDNKNTLDLIVSNHSEDIHSVEVEKVSRTLTDHDLVKCNIVNKFTKKQGKEEPYKPTHRLDALNLNKADWQSIRNDISVLEWENMHEKSVVEMCAEFDEHITSICEKHTPKHKTNKPRKFYIPRERRAMIKLKQNLNHKINCHKYLKTNIHPKDREKNIDELLSRKTDLEDKIKLSIINEEKLREEKMLSQIKTNPKVLYAHAKRMKKSASNIGPLEKDGILYDDATAMANILQQQYQSVFSNPQTNTDINIDDNNQRNSLIEDTEFTEDDIAQAINLLPGNSAGGPDKFPACILKECKNAIVKPLYMIWRKSLDTGEIPHIFLQQCIIPIFKKENRAKAENYRPVSLTSHLIKLFERVLRVKLIDYIESNEILTNYQYGFRQGRSCMSQLIHHYENLISILEENENADALYLDMSKAFDKVDHAILLKKLESIGIKGKIHQWLTSFLTNREQYVLVNGKKSESGKVMSGVPQGTVLGPLLFILYINDLPKYIKNCYLMIFADDSKIIRAINSMEDRVLFSEDIQSVTEWAVHNKMELNKLKYQLLEYGQNQDLKMPYNIDETTKVSKSSTVKDLGVHMAEDMLFDEHICKIRKKAKQVAGWIMRLVKSRSEDTVMLLYKTYVRPHLEYASCLWSPSKIKNIEDLESIQRSITSKIEGLEQLSYWERLKTLDLFSLQRRRERYDLIHIWKIQNNIIPNDLNMQFYETPRHGWKCKRNPLPSRQGRLSTIKEHSFTNRAAALYNSIPKIVKNVTKTSIFKSRLNKFLKKLPDTPPVHGCVPTNHNSILDWAASNWDGKADAFGCSDELFTDEICDQTSASGEEYANTT